MGNVGMKIVKSGKKIDSTDSSDYTFNSKNKLKLFLYKASFSLTATGGASKTFSHGLGFIPIVECYVNSETLGGSHKTRAPFNFTTDEGTSSPCSSIPKDYIETASYTVTKEYVSFTVSRKCIDLLDFLDKGAPPATNYTYNVDLYFYFPKL